MWNFRNHCMCMFLFARVSIIPAYTQLKHGEGAIQRIQLTHANKLSGAQKTVVGVVAWMRATVPSDWKLTWGHRHLSCQPLFIRDPHGFKVRAQNYGRRALITDQLRKPEHTQEIRKWNRGRKWNWTCPQSSLHQSTPMADTSRKKPQGSVHTVRTRTHRFSRVPSENESLLHHVWKVKQMKDEEE